MLSITKLKMWKDPGYTRQCVEVPPVGSKKLPTPDYESSETLRPRRGALLNAVELPLSYLDVHDMSYLYMEIEDGKETPSTMSVFGWILSVEETASSNEAVVIRWTPDYWRTYSDTAVFGKGTITRCANDTYRRPFVTQPRKLLKKSELTDPFNIIDDLYFVLMVSETQSDETTGFSYYWGVVDGPRDTDNHTRSFTSSEIYSGRLDEYIHDPNNDPIVPSSIVGGWVVPGALFGSALGPFDSVEVLSTTVPGLPPYTITYYRSTGLRDDAIESNRYIAGLKGYGTDDMRRCVSVNPYGQVISVLPWGFEFTTDYVDYTIDISPDGITVYYCDHAVGLEKALTEGNYLTFNALPIPLNTNAWSEYAYSYQRSYDKRMREIQRNQQTVSGFTGITGSIVGGSIAGASSGGPIGAIAGAVAGASSSLIGTTINYFAQGLFNDELQKETDKLTSNQTSNLLIGGGGLGWKNIANGWKIVELEADTVSLAEYTAKISNDGYDVEIPVGTPTAFLTAGGPLQIQNLVLTGSIPPEAKTYIKNILSNGVRIVENNPSGVVP